MLSTVLSDTRMCRKRGFGWALWSVKTDCTVYTLRESPPLLFFSNNFAGDLPLFPLFYPLLSHFQWTRLVNLKACRQLPPGICPGGICPPWKFKKSSGSLTFQKGERVALLKTLQSQVSHGFGVLDTDAPRLQCHLCHWMQLPRPGVCL